MHAWFPQISFWMARAPAKFCFLRSSFKMHKKYPCISTEAGNPWVTRVFRLGHKNGKKLGPQLTVRIEKTSLVKSIYSYLSIIIWTIVFKTLIKTKNKFTDYNTCI